MGGIQLGRMQFRIMQVLWDQGRASARAITDALNGSETVAHSTVQTLLRQLEAKGAVGHEATRADVRLLRESEGRQGQADGRSRLAGAGLRRRRGEPRRAPGQERGAVAVGPRRASATDRATRSVRTEHQDRDAKGASMGYDLATLTTRLAGFGLNWLLQSTVLLVLGVGGRAAGPEQGAGDPVGLVSNDPRGGADLPDRLGRAGRVGRRGRQPTAFDSRRTSRSPDRAANRRRTESRADAAGDRSAPRRHDRGTATRRA